MGCQSNATDIDAPSQAFAPDPFRDSPRVFRIGQLVAARQEHPGDMGQLDGKWWWVPIVVLVGAMLAATTGVVSASVISMGLISLPIMLRYGYSRRLATGVIAASGTLSQIIPPSLVLIVLADQLGRSVGDMYRGAMVPGLVLTGSYLLYILILAVLRPKDVPPIPVEHRTYAEANGRSGSRSLCVLLLISLVAGGIYVNRIKNTRVVIDLERRIDARAIQEQTSVTWNGRPIALLPGPRDVVEGADQCVAGAVGLGQVAHAGRGVGHGTTFPPRTKRRHRIRPDVTPTSSLSDPPK